MMSDIIKKLKDQATEDVLGVPVLNADLFAKLIVQECVETLGTFENYLTHEEEMAQLKKHFGVDNV